MSSLWTPGGEHEVPREPRGEPAPTGGTPPEEPTSLADIPGYDELSPEEQAQAQAMAAELAQARERLREVPAVDVVANHAMGLYELAAIHLGDQPPNLEEANIAIDALTAILAGLDGRLGPNEAVLREALQQLQLAFVQLSNAEGGMEP